MGDYKIDTTGIYFNGALTIDATKTYTVSGDSVDIDITNLMDLSTNQDISGVKTFLEPIVGDLSGNAASATQLETSRTIAGVPFDGTNSIDLPGVNTTGDLSGNAASATKLKTSRTIAGVSFDGTSNILSDLTYDASGRLGIGTTSPDYTLDVNGTIHAKNRIFLTYNNMSVGVFNDNHYNLDASGWGNTFFGTDIATDINSTSQKNTVFGHRALQDISNGNHNCGVGSFALHTLTSGSSNVAMGHGTLYYLDTGDGNTAFGHLTGHDAKRLNYCTFLGHGADVGKDVSNNLFEYSTAIGYGATIDSSNQIVLGRSNETVYIPGKLGIGTTTPDYLLDVSGNIRVVTTVYTSDDRLTHNETDISNALQHIRDLHPQHYIKTYDMYEADHHFNLDASGQPIDSSGNVVRHFIEEGLIAQDLLKLPAFEPFVFVPKDPTTKPYSVNYNSIFVHSLKALQELDAEHTQTKTELEQTKQSLTETITNLESLLQSALSRITALETQSTSS